MLTTCPRCAAALGAPLKSGRQVCPHCGWSTVVTVEKAPDAAPPPKPEPPQTGLARLVTVFVRVVVRIFAYFFNSIRHRLAQAFGGSGRKTGELFKNLSEKLQELEESIPTGNEPPETPWLYPRDAFQALGGIPEDRSSQLKTLDGKFLITYNQFRVLHDKDAYKMLGLEYSPERQKKGLTYLRLLPPKNTEKEA